jgi:hypothetical protein
MTPPFRVPPARVPPTRRIGTACLKARPMKRAGCHLLCRRRVRHRHRSIGDLHVRLGPVNHVNADRRDRLHAAWVGGDQPAPLATGLQTPRRRNLHQTRRHSSRPNFACSTTAVGRTPASPPLRHRAFQTHAESPRCATLSPFSEPRPPISIDTLTASARSRVLERRPRNCALHHSLLTGKRTGNSCVERCCATRRSPAAVVGETCRCHGCA